MSTEYEGGGGGGAPCAAAASRARRSRLACLTRTPHATAGGSTRGRVESEPGREYDRLGPDGAGAGARWQRRQRRVRAGRGGAQERAAAPRASQVPRPRHAPREAARAGDARCTRGARAGPGGGGAHSLSAVLTRGRGGRRRERDAQRREREERADAAVATLTLDAEPNAPFGPFSPNAAAALGGEMSRALLDEVRKEVGVPLRPPRQPPPRKRGARACAARCG